MHKYLLLILLMCVPAAAARAQLSEPKKKTKEISLNYGIRGGFNSSMNLIQEFKIKDVTIKEIQNNYRLGYFGAAFMRVNINRHFVQAEAMYTVSRSEVQFDKMGSQHPDITPDYAHIQSTIHSVEVPVTYGFNIIKKDPYEMYFFVGPQLKCFLHKQSRLKLINLDEQIVNEELYPVNVSAVLGVGVRIAHIIFDFRYDIGLYNYSRNVTSDNPDTESSTHITLDRRNNIMSFSLGFVF